MARTAHAAVVPQPNLNRPASLAQQLRLGAAATGAWGQPPLYPGQRPDQLTQQQQQLSAQQRNTLNRTDHHQNRSLHQQVQMNAAGPATLMNSSGMTGAVAAVHPGTAANGQQQQQQQQQPEQLPQPQSTQDFKLQLQLAQQQAEQHAAAAAQLKHQVRPRGTVLQWKT